MEPFGCNFVLFFRRREEWPWNFSPLVSLFSSPWLSFSSLFPLVSSLFILYFLREIFSITFQAFYWFYFCPLSFNFKSFHFIKIKSLLVDAYSCFIFLLFLWRGQCFRDVFFSLHYFSCLWYPFTFCCFGLLQTRSFPSSIWWCGVVWSKSKTRHSCPSALLSDPKTRVSGSVSL